MRFTSHIIKGVRNIIAIMAVGFSGALFTGCVNTDIVDKDVDYYGQEQYSDVTDLLLSLDLTTGEIYGTRATGDGDYYDNLEHQGGQTWENDIQSAVVILVNPQTDKVITSVYATLQSGDLRPADNENTSRHDNTYKLNQLLDREEFMAGYKAISAETNGENAGKKGMMVLVVANPPSGYWKPAPGTKIQDLQTIITTTDSPANGYDDPSIHALGKFGKKGEDKSVSGDGLGSGHQPFLMTNADYTNQTEDSQKNKYIVFIGDEDLRNSTGFTTTLDFGSVEVQRALARIDLNFALDEKKFDLGNREVTVILRSAGIVNVNKSFNLFKESGVSRTSGKWGYFWSEYFSASSGEPRYVFDPNYSRKKNLLSGNIDFDTYYHCSPFNESMFTNPENYDYIGGNVNKTGRIFGIYQKTAAEEDSYKIWRYVTPNTIEESNQQRNGISTGIVFIAKLNFSGDLEFGVKPGSETPVYMWNGVFYGTNRMLQERVNNPSNVEEKRMAEAYNRALNSATEADNNWKNCYNQEWNTDINSDFFKNYLDRKPSKDLAQALVDEGFSIFIPNDLNGDGNKEYDCVYFGWIKHNDNGNADLMGPMEFGVVRNTIYQVKVSTITKIGHPIPDPEIPTDPDPVKPDTPDEQVSRYISVDCKAIDWNVRTDESTTLY